MGTSLHQFLAFPKRSNAVLEEDRPRIMEASFPGAVAWAKRILSNACLKEQLATKGAAAQYVIGEDFYWAKRILDEEEKQNNQKD